MPVLNYILHIIFYWLKLYGNLSRIYTQITTIFVSPTAHQRLSLWFNLQFRKAHKFNKLNHIKNFISFDSENYFLFYGLVLCSYKYDILSTKCIIHTFKVQCSGKSNKNLPSIKLFSYHLWYIPLLSTFEFSQPLF